MAVSICYVICWNHFPSVMTYREYARGSSNCSNITTLITLHKFVQFCQLRILAHLQPYRVALISVLSLVLILRINWTSLRHIRKYTSTLHAKLSPRLIIDQESDTWYPCIGDDTEIIQENT